MSKVTVNALKQPMCRARHSLQSLFSLCVWCRFSSLLLLFLHSCQLKNLRITVICHHLHYFSSVLQMKHLLCCCLSLPACWLLPDLMFDSSACSFFKAKNWWANFVRGYSKTYNHISLNSLLVTLCQNPELLSSFATREFKVKVTISLTTCSNFTRAEFSCHFESALPDIFSQAFSPQRVPFFLLFEPA